jgi:hypothetical protein
MSLSNYSRYRRLKLRAAWQLAGMAVLCKEVGGYIVGFLSALALVSYITDASIDEDELHRKVVSEQHYAALSDKAWRDCVDNGGVFLIDGQRHGCLAADSIVHGD